MTAEVLRVGTATAYYAMVRAGTLAFEAPNSPSDVSIFFVVRGLATIEMELGQRFEINERAAFFYRAGVSGTASWPVDSAFVGIRVPEEVLAEMGAQPSTYYGSLNTCRFLSVPTVNFLKTIALNDASPTALSGYFVERMVQEMVGSLFLSHLGVETESVPSQTHLYQQAISIMTVKRDDPRLTPGTVARDLSVSIRKLQREFNARNDSPAGRIRKLRVELALQLLQNSAYDALSVEQIAKHSGFSSARQLRAALAAAGHAAPRQMRCNSEDKA